MQTNPSSSAPPTKPPKKKTVGDYVGNVLVFLMMASFGVVVNLVSYNDFVAIKDDLWLNSHGVLARNGSLYVHHHIHASSSLCAYYDTQEGKAYSKCIELWFPLVFIDEHSPEVIHYNPASPEHISTSWGRQVLFSRTFSLMVALIMALIIDLGVLVSIVGKLTGGDEPETAPKPQDSPQTVILSKASSTPGPGLRTAAFELSATLSQIVANLQSQTGPNAPYAQTIAAELTPLIAQYNQAVEARSREEAARALDEVADWIEHFKAGKKKRHMHFGFRHFQQMRKYESLADLFRETKYRNDSL